MAKKSKTAIKSKTAKKSKSAKPTKAADPTLAIRLKASQFAGVNEGTACTQASFKVGTKSFLFIGEQGGRYKAMFKLDKSIPEAKKLAAKNPDDYQVGNTAWVTARFSADKPLPKKVWQKWLEESYQLSAGTTSKPSKKAKKKKPRRRAQRKVPKSDSSSGNLDFPVFHLRKGSKHEPLTCH